jgi:hypothetical protein
MPDSISKRRRISKDGKSSPVKNTEDSNLSPLKVPPNVLPSYMTPTKASLGKSYPHLVSKSPVRGTQNIPVSPLRQPPRRSIPPELTGGLTEVLGVHGGKADGAILGSRFLDIANESDDYALQKDEEPTGMAMAVGKRSTAPRQSMHLSNEEEIEKHRSVLMRRLRVLRTECEDLEKQVDQARHATQTSKDARAKARADVDATMYSSFSDC